MSNKRGRDDVEDDALHEAAQELWTTLDRGPDAKLRALERLVNQIDHSDEGYTAQKSLVEADAAHYLIELLNDGSVAVALKAAAAIRAMSEHSAVAVARLNSGPLIGLENNVTRVLLNPVQGDFVSAIDPLVAWLLSGHDLQARTALETLTALCSYHQDGKIAYLECLTGALSTGQFEAIEHLDTLLDGMDCTHDEVVSLIDTLQQPLLTILSSSHRVSYHIPVLLLLGTIFSKCPKAATEYLHHPSEPVKLMAAQLLRGGLLVKDAAAHGLWMCVSGLGHKEQAQVLGCGGSDGDNNDGPKEGGSYLSASSIDNNRRVGGSLLGCRAEEIARQLQLLIDAAKSEESDDDDEDTYKRTSQDNNETVNEGTGGDRFTAGWANQAGTSAVAPDLELCYADEAELLLQALAKYNPELKVKHEEQRRTASCCVM